MSGDDSIDVRIVEPVYVRAVIKLRDAIAVPAPVAEVRPVDPYANLITTDEFIRRA